MIYALGSIHEKFGVWFKAFPKSLQRRNSQPGLAKRTAELCQIEPGVPNRFMTPNFFCTLFNVSGSAHEKFGAMIRFDNVLFANVLRILRPK